MSRKLKYYIGVFLVCLGFMGCSEQEKTYYFIGNREVSEAEYKSFHLERTNGVIYFDRPPNIEEAIEDLENALLNGTTPKYNHRVLLDSLIEAQQKQKP